MINTYNLSVSNFGVWRNSEVVLLLEACQKVTNLATFMLNL